MKRFLRGFADAGRGLWTCLREERNFRIHLCAAAYALGFAPAMALSRGEWAALLLTIGFWRTLFVVALGAAGMFIGGVKDKGQFIKNLVNRLFPPKDQN